MTQLLAGQGLDYINVGWLDKRYRRGLALEPIRGPGLSGRIGWQIIKLNIIIETLVSLAGV
jgi:hypothetical protein